MDIHKASYSTVAMLGDLKQFQEKLRLEGKTVSNVKDIRDSDESILMKSIAYGKFDIAKYLLENDTKVNSVSKKGNNELHYLAYHLNEKGALEIAYMLLERGVDLNARDKKFNNSAFWYLCLNARLSPTRDICNFISYCLDKNPDIEVPNNAGKTVKSLILESNELQGLLRKDV